jgi:hypothetical protein
MSWPTGKNQVVNDLENFVLTCRASWSIYLGAHPGDAIAVLTAVQAAIPNFEIGLAETPGNEARSLHGAFQVFQAPRLWLRLVRPAQARA